MATEWTPSPWTEVPMLSVRDPGARVFYRHADGRTCYRLKSWGPGFPCTPKGFATFEPQIPPEEFDL